MFFQGQVLIWDQRGAKNGAKKGPTNQILKKYSFKGVLEMSLMEERTLGHFYTKSRNFIIPFISLWAVCAQNVPKMPRNGPKQATFHGFCISFSKYYECF